VSIPSLSAIVLACLVALAAAKSFSGKDAQFESFKRRFGKTYKSAIEEEFRQKIFLNNLKTVNDHNKLFKEGKVTFDLAINKFADLTAQEFGEKYNGFKQPINHKPKNVFRGTAKAVPDTIDWRDSGYVTAVKDQGQCGSCWSFSATGGLEGQHFASTGDLIPLSEQNLMDCSYSYGNEACNGGWMDQAFQYIADNDGIDTEASYPYEEISTLNCRYTLLDRAATLRSYTDVLSGNEDALKQAAGTVGPISVAIDASHASFQLYNSGVYSEPLCMQNVLDHGVLVVGYGTEALQDYWLVKNSWGPSWGEQGYIKMTRNDNNQCGVATQASYPVL